MNNEMEFTPEERSAMCDSIDESQNGADSTSKAADPIDAVKILSANAAQELVDYIKQQKADHAAEIERLSKERDDLRAEIDDVVAMVKNDKTLERPWKDENLRMCVAVLLNALFWRNEGKVKAEIRAEAAESKLSQLQLSNEEKAKKIAETFADTCFPRITHGQLEQLNAVILAILNGGQQ